MGAYKVGGINQHSPEMEQAIGAEGGEDPGAVRVCFTALLGPMPRGIVATCSAPVLPGNDPGAIIRAAYSDEQFVTVLGEGQWPATGAVLGTNGAQLQVSVDEHAGRVIVVSVIDNLGKGAAGQAIQNANLMLGLDEACGLDLIGIAP